ncbi:MAG TPA: HAMP domain-containing sensor histidine kinase [Sunxiuqinia sp.]|nr:HAMP domain-containing sensor histidine kinase [Sunxiuqinia sp.]
MGRNTIRYVIILATFSVLGIILIQFFFLKNTVDLNEKRFHESTTQALNAVAFDLADYNSQKNPAKEAPDDLPNAVDQISNNYYVVNVNEDIHPDVLEHFLIQEFKKHNLNIDFEYAIYDCDHQKMVYGKYLTEVGDSLISTPMGGDSQPDECVTEEALFEQQYKNKSQATDSGLPTCAKYTYYFGVYFPNRSKYYSNQVHGWYVVNGFLLIVILFFGYTLFVIFKQRRLSEVQKNFINNLTHEFKTPIASIDLSSKVLADPKIINHPRRLSEYSKIISEQTQRLSAQVDKVLQMASLDKKYMELELIEIELVSFIQKSINDFKTSQNGNEYQIYFDSQVDAAQVKADSLHFSNVIYNILDNAMKYCDDVPKINVVLKQDKKHLYIEFADNGIGIPTEFRQKIFGRFFRIPTGDIHNVKGFGLGLDYVRKIIERHRWKIEVSDNSPKGSIFTIIIPR